MDPKRYKTRLAALKLKDAVFVDMLRGGAEILRIAAAQAYIKEIPLVITDLALSAEVRLIANKGIIVQSEGQVDGMLVLKDAQLANIMKIRLEDSFCGPVLDKHG